MLGLTVLAAPLLGGCADLATQDLCAQYDDVVASVEELRATDPVSTKAEQIRAAAAEVSDELDQFQAVTEGRLDDAVTRLRESVDAVRQAAVDAGADARETASPLIEQSIQGVRDAWAGVQNIAESQCPTAG
ncbi:hypothetical protein [Microbacterium sp. SLBN-154]|uniref:hypothetical protein n=1 Tax=Microbacterium sp. SLBN-154 TaxID=2768458 RepID=UPI0011531F00|nr:hypothetical protein [Microbacterium sp. SLBN-154]